MITAQVQEAVLPRNRPSQFEVWNPSNDGVIIKPMPDGDYLKVSLDGHSYTANESLFDLFSIINREAQILSTAGFTLSPVVGKDLIGSALDSINRVFSAVNARVVTAANRQYSSTFGGPLPYQYIPLPIRWTGESPEALKIVLKFVEAAYQVPLLRSNTVDSGLPSEHAAIALKPLFRLKAELMRVWFRMEIKGEISPQELDAIFRDSNITPPMGSSFDDQRDTVADLEAEDAQAFTVESAQVPTRETVETVQSGTDVWKWAPDAGNWATFAEIIRRHELDGPSQVVSAPFPFSLDAIGAGVSASGSGSLSGTPRTVSP